MELPDKPTFVVTGGAYGVTASCVMTLAQSVKARWVILGRSLIPKDDYLEYPVEKEALKMFLIKKFASSKNPAEIQRMTDRIMKERAIIQNLRFLERHAHEVIYHAIDIRDEKALDLVMPDKIHGIIHGAGIIEDRKFSQKTEDQFHRVFSTKVEGAMNLLRHVNPDDLIFIALFSSISGRFGNIGQVDYSAANEVLNKMASQIKTRCPNTRVVAINWGPWDSGMVSESLRRMYEQRGIGLIPELTGSLFFVEECLKKETATEVVITSSLDVIAKKELE